MTPQRSPAGAGGGGGTPALHYLSAPYGDTTFTKVFVGGLAWETRSEGLRAHFEAYGDILEAVVITDRTTGRSKGYGFVRTPSSSAFFLVRICCAGLGVLGPYVFFLFCWDQGSGSVLELEVAILCARMEFVG